MKTKTAQLLAHSFQIPLGQDFCTLPASTVCRVLEAADLCKYRKPKSANGSRARYFYAQMNRAKS